MQPIYSRLMKYTKLQFLLTLGFLKIKPPEQSLKEEQIFHPRYIA